MAKDNGPGPESFFLAGGSVGVLLIHGFTGSPLEMRRLGNYLHQRGLTVSAPLLPGHGTKPEDLNAQRWTNWTETVVRFLGELQARCRSVFIVGYSMGSLLTMYTAASQSDIAGIVTIAPAVEVTDRRAPLVRWAKYFMPFYHQKSGYRADPTIEDELWYYDAYPTYGVHEVMKLRAEVKRNLSRITCPLLVIYSLKDDRVPPKAANLVYETVSSTSKEMVELKESGHAIPVDVDWTETAESTYQFIVAHTLTPS